MMKDELPVLPANAEISSIGKELGMEDQHLLLKHSVLKSNVSYILPSFRLFQAEG